MAALLTSRPAQPVGWLVDGLLATHTCAVLAAGPMAGKSCMCLQLGDCVSRGRDFLGRRTTPGGVLYLALEDGRRRLRDRLGRLAAGGEGGEAYEFAERSATISTGFVEQLGEYLTRRPEVRLVIVDPLQAVRDTLADCGYQADYADMRRIKAVSDEHDVCVLLVHGTYDVSGAPYAFAGLDQIVTLAPDRAEGTDAYRLKVEGRDIEGVEMLLRRDGVAWEHVRDIGAREAARGAVPGCVRAVADHALASGGWSGTATKLADELGLDVKPNVLSRRLAENEDWLADEGIDYVRSRASEGRTLELRPVARHPAS